MNQLTAIRNALEKAHEIQLETQLQQGFCFAVALLLVGRQPVGSKLTDHLQIMAVQQQKQAIAEEKRTRELNIRLKAQYDSVSAGMRLHHSSFRITHQFSVHL